MAELWNRVCREIPPVGCQLIPQGRGLWIFQAGSLSWGPGRPEEIIPQAIREGARKGWPSLALRQDTTRQNKAKLEEGRLPPALRQDKTKQDKGKLAPAGPPFVERPPKQEGAKMCKKEPAPPCPSKRSAAQEPAGARSDKKKLDLPWEEPTPPRKKPIPQEEEPAPFVNVWARPKPKTGPKLKPKTGPKLKRPSWIPSL